MRTVVGMFDTRSEAEAATERLQDVGINRDRLSFASKESRGSNDLAALKDTPNWGGEGAASGMVLGAGVSVLAGLAIATSTVVLPGVGAFLVGGPLFASLTGAGLGGLIGAGIPKDEAEHFSTAMERGQIIVAAHVESVHVSMVRTILEEEGSLRTYNS
jgi:hypothetical protein